MMPYLIPNLDPCTCGHTRAIHTDHYGFAICEDCANSGADWWRDYRHAFQLDNLKYLEQQYENHKEK